LASLSKAFAGTMAGLLVNDGTLRWDSKVTDFVPGFKLSSPEATERLTVADVLSHRVGSATTPTTATSKPTPTTTR
jgi:beta-lactamase class C